MKRYENLKKVELHCHLDGSLNPLRVSKWTRKNVDEVVKLLNAGKTNSLEEFLKGFDYPISLLQSKTRLKDAASELCNDLLEDGVIYAEVRFDPVAHTSKGLSLDEVVEAILEGLSTSSLKTNLILCMKREREDEVNKLVIDLAKKYSDKGVVAVDLAGDERAYPTKDFKELFVYAKELGVPYVIHAGEVNFKDIDYAVSFGAKRIGHGVAAIKSFETMEKLKKHDIPLEICLSSNIDTGIYEDASAHPIARLVDSGVKVTINTDNRSMSDTTLTDEYNLLNKYFGFNVDDFNRFNRCAIEHSFLNKEEKEELLKNF